MYGRERQLDADLVLDRRGQLHRGERIHSERGE